MVQGLDKAADTLPPQQNCELTQLTKAVAKELDNADVNGVLKLLEQAKKEYGLPGLKLVVEGAEKLETNHVGLDMRLSHRPHAEQSVLRGDSPIPNADLTIDAKLLYFTKDTSDANVARIKTFLDQAAGEGETAAFQKMELSLPQIAANWVDVIKHGQGQEFSKWAADVLNKSEHAEYYAEHGGRHEEVMSKEVFYRTVEEMQKVMPRQEFAKYLPHRNVQESAEAIKDDVVNRRFNPFNNLNYSGETLLTDAQVNGTTWVPAEALKGFTLEQSVARVATLQDEKANYEKCMISSTGGTFGERLAPNRVEYKQQQCSDALHHQLDRKQS